MNKCVGIMFQNEAHWLRLHLPHLVSDKYDIVMLDGGSTDDSVEVACKYAKHVWYNKFIYNWAYQSNMLLHFAAKRGYAYMVRLDPDELMFVDEIVNTLNFLEKHQTNLVAMKRFNFEYDRNNVRSDIGEDWQVRGIHTAASHYEGKVHEHLLMTGASIYYSDDAAIYHYEGLNTMQYRTLKGLNYVRISQGLQPLDEVPREIAAQPMNYCRREPFVGRQPVEFKNPRVPFGD